MWPDLGPRTVEIFLGLARPASPKRLLPHCARLPCALLTSHTTEDKRAMLHAWQQPMHTTPVLFTNITGCFVKVPLGGTLPPHFQR